MIWVLEGGPVRAMTSYRIPDNCTPVAEHEDEFQRVQYLLRYTLWSVTARVMEVYAVSSPRLALQFDKFSKNTQTVQSFVPMRQLIGENTIDSICTNGFRFGERGAVFPHGYVSGLDKGRATYEVVLCRVAAGRSLSTSAAALREKRPSLPDGYNSFLVLPPDGTAADLANTYLDAGIADFAGAHNGSERSSHFLIHHEGQVIPEYIIRFEYDPTKTDARPICESCEQQPAVVHCKQDNAKLCESCDRDIHASNKLLSRHERISLNFCPEHLRAAYEEAVAAADEEDPVLEGRKQSIVKALSELEQLEQDVHNNAQELEEQIMKYLERLILQLQEEAQRKLSVLVAEDADLRRQYQQIVDLEKFLTFHRGMLTPVEFLAAWKQHSRMRGELHAKTFTRQITAVRPDLKVEGKLVVQSGGFTLGAGGDELTTSQPAYISSPTAAPMPQRASYSVPATSGVRQALFSRFGANGHAAHSELLGAAETAGGPLSPSPAATAASMYVRDMRGPVQNAYAGETSQKSGLVPRL